jgi:hypothetical protein
MAIAAAYNRGHGGGVKLSIVSISFGLIAWSQTVDFSKTALQPGTQLTWSQEAGRLADRDSQLVVTAIALRSAAGQPLRGVRIEFSQADWKASVYMDSAMLESEKSIFEKLAHDVELIHPSGSRLAFIGSCEFRNQPDRYPLMADFEVSGPDAPALRVWGPEMDRRMMFTHITPENLAKLLGNAVEALNSKQ